MFVQLPDLNTNDGSTVERYSWVNGDGCVNVEELKIINGGHDWPSPLSSWANQDINANVEVWNFVSKFNMTGLIGCNSINHVDLNVLNSKSLLRIIDMTGKETEEKKNTLLFYLYDDGSVEKRIIIE